MSNSIEDQLSPSQTRLKQAIEELPVMLQHSAAQFAAAAIDHIAAMLRSPIPVPPGSVTVSTVSTTCPKCSKAITISIS